MMEEHDIDMRHHADEAAQMDRQHILMVNRTPALLDLVRVVLDGEHYNVTTTNAVPLTFALIDAARPALIIIDLMVAETSGWNLLVRLHTEATTAAIPIIITATDIRLLDRARRYPELFGARSYLTVPFTVEALLRQVRALIGTSEPAAGHISTTDL